MITRTVSQSGFLPVLPLALVVFAIYLATLSPVFVSQDTPEFIAASLTLGVAHPPGHPVFLLLGKLFSLFPLGSLAYRVNLMTALLGVLGAVFAYVLSRRIFGVLASGEEESPRGSSAVVHAPVHVELLSLGVALLFAFSHAFWSYTVFAEVYSIQMVFLLGLLQLAFLGSEDLRSHSPVIYCLAFGAGLALGIHTTLIIYFPAVLFVLLSGPHRPKPSLSLLAGSVCFFLIGLSVYLYLPLRASTNPPIDIGDPRTLKGTLDLIAGRMYYGAYHTPAANLLLSLQFFGRSLFNEFPLFSPPLALFGCLYLLRKQGRLFLTTLLLLAPNVLFFGSVNQQAAPIPFYFPDYVFVPAYWVWALWIALGVVSLWETISRLSRPLSVRLRSIINAVPLAYFLILPALSLVLHYHDCDASRLFYRYDMSDYVFRRVKPHSIILSTDTVKVIFPLWYFQHAEHRYRDLTAIAPSLEQWNVYNLREMPGLEFPRRIASAAPMKYAELTAAFFNEFIHLNIKQHPFYTTLPDTALTRGYYLVPHGYLYEIRESKPVLTVSNPTIQKVNPVRYASNLQFEGYSLSADSVRQGRDFTISFFWKALGPVRADYSSMLELTDPTGLPVARVNYPDITHKLGYGLYPSSRWKIREVIREDYSIFVPSDLRSGTYGLNLAVGDTAALLDVEETALPVESKFARIGEIAILPNPRGR